MSRTTRALSATVSGVALALALPAAASAIDGGVDPTVTPPVYPTTTTPVGGWKTAGTLRRPPRYNDTYGVSAVLIAPRLVLASAHAAGEKGGTFTLPTGESATFVANGVRPTQRRVGMSDPNGTADISLQRLDRSLPAPPGGFPLLLTDRVTTGLDASLPGHVLWAGRGGTVGGKTLAGWARPDGLPMPGSPRLATVDGDSGSAGLLYLNSTARPILAGITSLASITPFGQFDLNFGGVPGNVTLGDPLVPGGTFSSRHATVGAWLKSAIDTMALTNWSLERPTFATLAQAGINVATLRAAPPESVTLAASTPTNATITWSHSSEARLARTGYRVLVSSQPGTSWTTTGTSLQVTGLEPGTEHRFTVRAYNANGESLDQRGYDGSDPTTVTYARAVRDLTITTSRVDGSTTGDLGGGTPGADYCAEVSWLPSIADAGTSIGSYSVALGAYVADIEAIPGTDGRVRMTRCGLEPAQLQTAVVRPVVAGAEGAPATASATTPTGPAPGTL